MKKLFILSLIFAFFSSNIIFGQKTIEPSPKAIQIAQAYITLQQQNWKLSDDDTHNFKVQDSYSDDFNGVTHVFFIQQSAGIELGNAIVNVSVLPNGEVVFAGNRSMPHLSTAVNATQPVLTPEQAVRKACENLKVSCPTTLHIVKGEAENTYTCDKGDFVLSDIHIKLRYQRLDDKTARLAWDLNIYVPDESDHWSLRVDALNGDILDKNSWTTHCSFNRLAGSPDDQSLCDEPKNIEKTTTTLSDKKIEENQYLDITNRTTEQPNNRLSILGDNASYRVFPLPVESPSHGARQLITNPADPKASPFGWHDTDGIPGPEYTITRGNNVHAYLDWKATGVSSLDEPSNQSLTFDFPFDNNLEPDTNRNAAVVNLFYVNNMMHDISYYYGFTESSGNFQTKNYTGAPGANDWIKAHAQDGAKLASPSLNNANFTRPPDGESGTMNMYVWSLQNANLLHVTAPGNLAGDFTCGTASFGSPITTTHISGQVVLMNDGSGSPTLGCNLPALDYTGKIVLIDRGTCYFDAKVFNAQQKGAIGVIVVDNLEENTFSLGQASVGASVKIPSVLIKKLDGNRLRSTAGGNGLFASLYSDGIGPNRLDGDFDNGIVSHEYTHGISGRLTGGRLNANCLQSGEEANGEGWSDFMGLVITTTPADRGNTLRGVGTYVTREPNNGVGIRIYPYTNDMSIDKHTYDDIIADTEVHDVGEVWTSVLWDLYWRFVDIYGWNADLKNITSGNGKMVRLVFDALKMQPCNPGFLDARDAVLAADRADFNGDNQCLIWETFARRGMGYNADQGNPLVYNDNTQGFDQNPYCIKTLKIIKTATASIKPGDNITYTVTVINHKGIPVTGVVVTDSLPAGTTVLSGSPTKTIVVAGGVATWNIGNMNALDTAVLTYKVVSDISKKSTAQFFDDFEHSDNNWNYDDLKGKGNIFGLSNAYSFSGKNSMSVVYATTPGVSDVSTFMIKSVKVTGKQPVLRFYHYYDTEPGVDGGFVQISINNGVSWDTINRNLFFKNPNRGKISTKTFFIGDLQAFWGSNKSFNPTCIDLSPYLNQNIKLRFRFGNDSLVKALGWFIDDVTVMDVYNYNSRATVRSAQNDISSAMVAERGTLVDPTIFTPTEDIKTDFSVKVYPNPAQDLLNIQIRTPQFEPVDVRIYSITGQELWQKNIAASGQDILLPVNISGFGSGIYFIRIGTGTQSTVEKFVVSGR